MPVGATADEARDDVETPGGAPSSRCTPLLEVEHSELETRRRTRAIPRPDLIDLTDSRDLTGSRAGVRRRAQVRPAYAADVRSS